MSSHAIAAEQSDWCTFRVSNGAMGTVAFTPSLKVRRHWDSAQTLAANPTKPASTREVFHPEFGVFDINSLTKGGVFGGCMVDGFLVSAYLRNSASCIVTASLRRYPETP